MAKYTQSFRVKVGRMLIENPGTRQKIIARELLVTERTLRLWKNLAKKELKTQGGPTGPAMGVVIKIARQWKRQGGPGYRPIVKALPGIRVRVVKMIIAELKRRKKQRQDLIRKKVRVRVRVNRPGAVVTMDGATAKKGADYIVYRDRGSVSTNADECGGVLNAQNTVNVLNGLKSQGRLPLVMCTDNGSPFCAQVVEDFMSNNFIVHLKSLPRVPQQNGSCENAVGEFKALINDGYSPKKACEILNERRKRRTLNYWTSNEFDKKYFQPYTDDARAQFFYAAKDAIRVAQLGTKSVYEKKKAEREAIFKTLESFSIITRTRGNRPLASGPEESP